MNRLFTLWNTRRAWLLAVLYASCVSWSGFGLEVSVADGTCRAREGDLRIARDSKGVVRLELNNRAKLAGPGQVFAALPGTPARILPLPLKTPLQSPAVLLAVVNVPALPGVFAMVAAAPPEISLPVRVRLAALGLGPGPLAGFEPATNRFLGPLRDEIVIERRVYGPVFVAARLDRPVVLAYSGCEQGEARVSGVAWLADRNVLTGKAALGAKHPMELRIFAPPAPIRWLAREMIVGPADTETDIMQTGPWVRAWTLQPPAGVATWRVRFERGKPRAPTSAGVRVEAAASSARRVRIQCYGTRGPLVVRRDDGVELPVSGGTAVDSHAPPGRKIVYTVYPVAWTSQPPKPLAAVKVTTPKLPPLPPRPDVYCADLKPKVWTSGWNGAPRRDLSIEDNPIRIRGETFEKGIGTHAVSEIVFPVLSNYRRFVAVVGVDDEKNDTPVGSVTFEVLADNKRLVKTPVLTPADERYPIDVALPKGTKTLRLIVGDGGNGNACDHADWANAGFIVEGEPTAEELLSLWVEDGFTPMFDGRSLGLWSGDATVWSVRAASVHGETKGAVAQPVFLAWNGAPMKNFLLKLRFRVLSGNAAVAVRTGTDAAYRILLAGGPDRVGALSSSEGTVLAAAGEFVELGERSTRRLGAVVPSDAFRKEGYSAPGQWASLAVRARGRHLAIEINGLTVTELVDLRSGGPTAGRVGLELIPGEKAVAEFKEIQVRPITAEFGAPVHLFNGRDLSGWTYSNPNQKNTWSVKDGVLDDTGKPAGYFRTARDFTNYVLRVQLRHLSRGNSGVLLRMVGKDKVWPRAIECQGLIGNLGDIWNIDKFPMKTDPQRTRGRHTVKAHRSNERPLGEWNQYDITLDGEDLEIRVNGLLQNVARDCWETPGKICLQAEGAHMQFRHITLIPIARTSQPRRPEPKP
ncbi:MAG: DUF1080 domain-containing protein [Kiritimatiellaeota bacterium]|nr:DUF1080 domain-containing protein [Kiritimatiellota bacterium]